MSYLLPWQLQLIVPSATEATGQPMCVQIELKALNCPAAGCVITVLVAATMVPPPTGISEVSMPSEPPESEEPAALGLAALLEPPLEPPAAGAPAVELLPHAATTVAPAAGGGGAGGAGAAGAAGPATGAAGGGSTRRRAAPTRSDHGGTGGGEADGSHSADDGAAVGVCCGGVLLGMGHGGPPVPGRVRSPLLQGRTAVVPRRFTLVGPGGCARSVRDGQARWLRGRTGPMGPAHRPGVRVWRPPDGPVQDEQGATDGCGRVRRLHGGTAGIARRPSRRPRPGGPGLHGRAGLPAGPVLRPRLLRRRGAAVGRGAARGPVLAAGPRAGAPVVP